jgi:hypothetical protein
MKFITILADPRFFTWLIMSLYAVNALQYLCRGYYIGFGYWAFALGLTLCAVSGFNR